MEWGDDEVQINGDLLLADTNRESVINVRDALGGGGGTTDYTLLSNKPQINGHTLTGNLSTSDLDITIPTVNNGKLTIGRNGTKLNDFYANSSTNVSVDISVPVEDVQINGTSILSNKEANIRTNSIYNSSTNKIATMSDIPTVPTTVSSFTNDAGYITGINSSDVTTALGFTPQEEITNSNKLDYSLLSNTPTIPDELADLSDDSTHRLVTDSEKSTWNNKSDFSGSYNDLTDTPTLFSGSYNDLTDKPTLFSGDYDDLTNKPTIKEPTYSSSQYNLGYYSDPASVVLNINNTMYLTPNEYGIDIRANTTTNLPSDLVTILGTDSTEAILKTYSSRQTNNAWAGLRQELYAPRITDRSWYRNIKGTSSGGTFGNWYEMASTSDISNYHDSSKQDTLVSGTNIKTINNTSLLGSGNINISGGGTATDVQINGTSITSSGTANILTNGTYSSSNKIATMNDLPTVPSNVSAFNNDAGYLTSYTETDPVFSASASAGITSTDISSWNGKAEISDIPTPNIMTAYLKADYSIPNTNTIYSLTNMEVAESVGSKLTLSNGKIVIGAGVSKVKVSYTAKVVSNANTTRTFTYLIQETNGVANAISQEGYWYGGTNWQVVNTYGPRVVSVNQGDEFYINCYGYKNNSIAGANSTFIQTFITVEVIE